MVPAAHRPRPLADVDLATIDRLFGNMRGAGLSRSRMNQARALWAPLFRWSRKRHMVHANPLDDFELPTSTQVPRDRVPPEVEELSLLLAEAAEVVPDIAPLLVLGAVTGMRRGELASLRRTDLNADRLEISVAAATDRSGRLKATKTRRRRTVQTRSQENQVFPGEGVVPSGASKHLLWSRMPGAASAVAPAQG